MKVNITIDISVDELKDLLGEETLKKDEVKIDIGSKYAKIFGPGNPMWDKDSEISKMILATQQNYFNDMLRHKGYLFLNEVYRLLGLSETKEGQVVGWIYNLENPNGDNYVDLGLNDPLCKQDDGSFIIDPNVDGYILDKF